uniref:Ankyrin repeat, SAM and basic leucine zipper domain containing 1 n=1 Tax=Xiphophorus maculatus TaxID=8083 RepID=M4AJ49_XIPMA
MGSVNEFAFPAGDESDASNDEWDIGSFSENKTSASAEVGSGDKVSVLKKAISEGDTDTVKQLLNNGLDVETRLGFGWTPLMYAVSVANCNLARLLLDRGASANFSKDCWTVLMASCTASSSEDKIAHCIELLLSRSADPNMVDRSQMTCLMLAARDGLCKVINLLVSHGAEINVQDSKGYTALSIAVQYGKEQAVLKLLQLGADKTIRTKTGKSPANLAEMHRHTQVMSSYILYCMFNQDLFSVLCSATKLDELELLLHGLNLGYLNDIMTTSLRFFAVCQIGITNPVDQQKVLSAVQQMHLDKVDLDKIQLGTEENGCEDLQNFLLSVRHQCCYLTEMLQDVISRFPRQASQLVISLDPKKEAQTVCRQLVVQTKDLQKEVSCLHNLLSQKSNNRTPLEFRSGGLFLPTTPLQVSLSLPT